MNINLHVDLLLYGIVLMGFGTLAQWLAADQAGATVITGIVGGVLCIVWGVLGLRGFKKRVWPIRTLVVLDATLLVQAISGWVAVKRGMSTVKPVAMILTLMLVFGIGQLINFLQKDRR